MKRYKKKLNEELTKQQLRTLSDHVIFKQDRDGEMDFYLYEFEDDDHDYIIGSLSPEQVAEMQEDGFTDDEDYLSAFYYSGEYNFKVPYYTVYTYDEYAPITEYWYKFQDKIKAVMFAKKVFASNKGSKQVVVFQKSFLDPRVEKVIYDPS